MISDIGISNFKSIKQIEGLKLKPLTLFTGVNSSGKSNILEAISFFGQASRSREIERDRRPNLLTVLTRGDVKQYPRNVEDYVIYKKNPKDLVKLEINLEPDKSFINDIESIIKKSPDLANKYVFKNKIDTKVKSIGYHYSFIFSRRSYMQGIKINEKTIIYAKMDQQKGRVIAIPAEFDNPTSLGSLEEVLNSDVFRPSNRNPNLDFLSELAGLIIEYLRKYTKQIYLISGERGNIKAEFQIRERPRTLFTPSWIGTNGQHLIEILSRCFTREREKYIQIREWAEKFQLSSITAGYVGTNILESNFTDKTLNISLNSSLAGLGSRQILSIITQIFWSEPNSVIMIEEPEISLHPENQVLLHELFSEAISQDKQIICTTHSPFFVLALSKIIKRKLLTSEDIVIYHVDKDKNGTHVKELKINKYGFVAKGIPSFMKVEQDLFRDWSESLEDQ